MVTIGTIEAFDAITQAIYDVEQPRERWLLHVLAAASDVWPGAGVAGLAYDVSGEVVRAHACAAIGFSDSLLGIGIAQHQHNEFGEVLLRSYRNVTCSRQSEYLGQFHAPMEMAAQFRLRGGNDAWLVNGLDDNQQGLALYFMPSTDQAIASDQSRHLERLAKHLARGHRLHRKLIQEQCHPMADAKPSVASDHIREASRARCPSGIVGDASAVSPTFCAVEGIGLTLVHEAGPGGRHYTIARASTSGSHAVDRLTSRERQVAMLVLLGRTNKEIAYELQMAHATVRVLVARAGKKLGVGSREEFFKILIEDPYFARKHERCKPDGA